MKLKKGINNKNIRDKQYELNELLSEVKFDNKIVDNKTLKMSQDLDKLIVNYYKNKYKNLNEASI
ncbi:Spo0E family sporulation regulatory protein-aspartic acid phosphatase [Sporosalibacterium faouarense]|uniref:Spo0E family sporulation regulatory protein-aspartic acid phosphatase n=1 Tax=Sporosalibacterium faouarense TaxID=516123 RepID=UPI00141C6319|nr:Spo0E family sporulation regulatory protein-aspartic acid phosphatase [Sporosalibacterium faouarense]MTI47414.1 Spo0E family sporulation regulatory protein-aspartic acid phosphatase [Bacillota bacterium]